ncbi:MAG: Hpt domain-containing protein [Lachnospiraceae bacterium]|nr:Hpt domain-containing protein [Lachnospiraceae bacterium]
MELNWLNEKGLSVSEGIGYTGSEEKYLSALQRFFKGYEGNAKLIREALAAEDIENYSIRVHSLKSNSRMIGADALAEGFEKLEAASKDKDTEFIHGATEDVLKQYAEVCEWIRPIGEMERVKVSGEISAEEARETADKLLEALDEYDDGLSAELAARLMGYPFRLTQKQKLKEALDHIGDFMYEEAAELVKEILPAIE